MNRANKTIKSILVATLLAFCSLYIFDRVLGMFTSDISFFIIRKLRYLFKIAPESSEAIKSVFLALTSIFIRLEQYLTALLVGLIIGQIFKEKWLRLVTLLIFFTVYFYLGMSFYFLEKSGLIWGQLSAIALIVAFGLSGAWIKDIQIKKTKNV